MKEFLEQKEDYNIITDITFGTNFSLKNIKAQIEGILFKTDTLGADFKRSIEFLEDQLEKILVANKSLEIIESRFQNIKASMDFILKSRYEIAENTKGVSVIDLTKGNFDGLNYNIGLKGLTFERDIGSEQVSNIASTEEQDQ